MFAFLILRHRFDHAEELSLTDGSGNTLLPRSQTEQVRINSVHEQSEVEDKRDQHRWCVRKITHIVYGQLLRAGETILFIEHLGVSEHAKIESQHKQESNTFCRADCLSDILRIISDLFSTLDECHQRCLFVLLHELLHHICLLSISPNLEEVFIENESNNE